MWFGMFYSTCMYVCSYSIKSNRWRASFRSYSLYQSNYYVILYQSQLLYDNVFMFYVIIHYVHKILNHRILKSNVTKNLKNQVSVA